MSADADFSDVLDDLCRERDQARAALRDAAAREAALLDLLRTARHPDCHPSEGRHDDWCLRRRAALASPSAAAQALLERVRSLEALAYIGDHHFPDMTWKVRCGEAAADLRKAEADRDRWLGHCRALVAWATGVAPDTDAVGAARRDLEQHDGEGRAAEPKVATADQVQEVADVSVVEACKAQRQALREAIVAASERNTLAMSVRWAEVLEAFDQVQP